MVEEYSIDLPQPFLQRHLERYQMEMRKLTKESAGDIALAVMNGSVVIAAVRCGWLEVDFEEEDIRNQPAWLIEEISGKIYSQIDQATTRPEKN